MDLVSHTPIATFPEVAQLVDMPESTLRTWAKSTDRRRPLVHTSPNARRGWPTIPLAGIVEARSLRAIRSLTSMQKIVPVVERMRTKSGDEYVLAKPMLFVDLAGELYEKDSGLFIRARDQQVQMPKVFDEYMSSIEFDSEENPVGYRIVLPGDVVLSINPGINAGRPSFPNGTPAFAVLGAYDGGDSVRDISEGFGVAADDIEAAIDYRERFAA